MKRIKYLVLTIIGVMFFTGCAIKMDVNMEISKDGKINFGLIQAFDRELLTNMMNMGNDEANYTDEELKQFLKQSLEESEDGESSDLDAYKQKGFTVTEYLDDKFLGYKFSTTIDDIDTVSADTETSFDFSNIDEITGSMQEQKIFKKENKQYTANFIFDPKASALDTEDSENAASEENDDATNEQMEQYLSMIEQIYTFTLTLPKTPISHNATTVSEDGKTLTWNLSKDTKTSINFTFALEDEETPIVNTDNDSSLWLYIAIGLGVLILVIVIVVLLMRKKENINENSDQTNISFQDNDYNNVVDKNLSFENKPELEQNLNDSATNNGVIGSSEALVANSNISAEEMQTEETSVDSDIDSNMIIKNNFCINCGSKIIENTNFCVNCGNKLK